MVIKFIVSQAKLHKQDCKSAGHARKKPHLPICACIIRKEKKNIEVSAIADVAGPEKQ